MLTIRWLLVYVAASGLMTDAPMGQAHERVDTLLTRARSVLAQIDGRIEVDGLKQPVEVRRDRWGIAHIEAQNSHDLFFAQGYCMAQDRLFQVDLWRRIARGETAELFGEEAIEADRLARLLRYRGDMDAEWTSYSPDTREIATAFTAGINAYITAVRDRLPIEFQLAGYQPQPWQAEDILGRMSGIIMSSNWEKEVTRARLIQAVGLEKARVLAPTDPPVEFGPAPDLDLAVVTDKILSGVRAVTRILKFTPSTSESNNWVVSGALTHSGKPLLASDPHRATSLPSLRYLVHLKAPGWNVIGSGEPALPGVALGHNERIAWGFTIVGTDQADLFVERTHPEDPRQYRVGDRWASMQVIHESIQVRGRRDPLPLELRFTRHGPVVYQDETAHIAIALKWAGSEPGGAAYLASLAVARAQHREQFRDAIARWKIPCLNFVYADVDGQIGWIAAAATPVRRSGTGLLPVPGNSDDYEWQRYLSVDELPQSFNPASGWLATANHNIVPAGYRHQIAYEWSGPYRYRRIAERLNAQRTWTIEDFQSLQHDTTSLPARALQSVIKSIRFPQDLRKYVDLLSGWNCDLTRSSQAGPLYAVWMQELMAAMYAQHAKMDEAQDRGDLRSVQVILQHLEQPTDDWFGTNAKTKRDALVIETLRRATDRTKKLLSEDSAAWQWGRLHQATFRHSLESFGADYAKAFNAGPVPRGGDSNTPLNTRYDKDFQQIHGATYRHIIDLSDWDRAVATSAPGQSGQPGSPHYDDLLPLWAEGKYFPLAYSRTKIEQLTQHLQLLEPRTAVGTQNEAN
jgi:penicillin amidase